MQGRINELTAKIENDALQHDFQLHQLRQEIAQREINIFNYVTALSSHAQAAATGAGAGAAGRAEPPIGGGDGSGVGGQAAAGQPPVSASFL